MASRFDGQLHNLVRRFLGQFLVAIVLVTAHSLEYFIRQPSCD